MPDANEKALVVDEQEEAYLRSAFHRFARPYLITTFLLVVGLWFLGAPGAGSPGSEGAEAPTASSEAKPQEAAAQIAALSQEIAALRSQVRHLEKSQTEARSGAPTRVTEVSFHTSPEWKALAARLNAVTTRVQTLESSPAPQTRVERVVRAGAPDDGSLASLMERVYNIELRQEQEEAAFKATQKSLLDRVYALETRREEALAERTALDQSMMKRMKNIEGRLYASEQRQAGSQPAAPAR